ncbi:MAG: hypothetical protein EHM81_13415, partial [Chloroflexi bacterium]
ADNLARQGLSFAGADAAIFMRDAFAYGIHSLAWSPDGKYLAFAGQMDGLSSDLYTCEIETRAIQRLSDGIEQIQSIAWSPDGKWILHGSANQVGAGMEINYHAAAVDGSAMKTLFSGVASFWGWLTPDRYLHWNVLENSLQSVDIETGSVQTLWQGVLMSLAFDPANDTLAVIGRESTRGGGPIILFFIDLASGATRKIAESVTRIEFIGFQDRRFFATAQGKPYFVKSDGSLVETGLDEPNPQISVSPGLRMVVVPGDSLRAYSWDNELIGEIDPAWPAGSEARILWQPGAPGVFIALESDLYAADFINGKVSLIDDGAPGSRILGDTISIPADFGAEAVWDTPQDEFADCAFASDTPLGCVVAVMQAAGASRQAVDFTRLVYGHAYLESFLETGKVDVARMVVLPRPNDILQYVMVNGAPRVVYAADDLGQVDITQAPNYPALLKKYPGLTLWESLNLFEGVEQLPGGGQRFIFRYDLVDGCHICRTGASAFVAFDFDRAGQFLGTTLLYLKE